MSSRQLRKLQRQKELQELTAQPSIKDNESSDDDRPVQKPRASVFSGFAALQDQDAQDDDTDHDEKEDELVATSVIPVVEPDTPKTSSKKNKKKKKKAKKKTATLLKGDSVSQNEPDDTDELDEILKEFRLSNQLEKNNQHDDTKPYERVCELLSINTYHLKVVNEMRNLFGREVMTAAQNDANQDQTRAGRQQRPSPLPDQVDMETFINVHSGQSLPEITLRRNPFLAGKDTWPRASTEGLTMEQLPQQETLAETREPGKAEFRFAHDVRYNNLEKTFFELVQMHDPMYILNFVRIHPYHISSLIQASRIAKQSRNSSFATDLCERALFTFGRISLSAFRQKMEQGKARLSFARPENRQFWLAGYHYINSLMMKGTNRTALEWAKLLLSLDHGDPYGVIHHIHPLAIRAHESKWFIDLCASDILAVNPRAHEFPDYVRQTLVLAKLQQEDIVGAKELLIEGIKHLPWLYSYLFKALNLDVPKAIWGVQPRNRAEELHASVYIHQTKGLWDSSQVKALLKETANGLKKADIYAMHPFPAHIEANFARFIFLLEVPSLIAFIPHAYLDTSTNWEFDPLPPPEDVNIFSYESQRRPWIPTTHEEQFAHRFAENTNDRTTLQGILEQAREGGVPLAIQQDIQRAIDRFDGSLDAPAEEEVDDGEDDLFGLNHASALGMFQHFMSLFNTHNHAADVGHSESDLDDMPGVWFLDEDDELNIPPLISQDEDIIDEIPPLISQDEDIIDEIPPLISQDEDMIDEMPPLISQDEDIIDEMPPWMDRNGSGNADIETDDEMPELI
ncbi:DUF654-domain-containing protein [Jackrogersella minutella]|nr:DUF654-domain-containing protein [Jackrogersella minutella]